MKIFTRTLYLFLLMMAVTATLKAQVVTQAWATLDPDAGPTGIALDAAGNVYTANSNNGTVSKMTPSGTLTQSWATLDPSAYPYAIALDASGNVYTANYISCTVSKITPSGTVTQSWAALASDAGPRGITIDASGNVYAANYDNNTVSKITASGTVTQSWATLASGANPNAVTTDASGNVYTANYGNNTVSKITSSGTLTQSWAALASGASPYAITIDASGNLYIANSGNNTVSKITSSGTLTQSWATLNPGAAPDGIAVDTAGNVYTANNTDNTVSKITASGTVTKAWAALDPNAVPYAMAINASGNLYTANLANSTVSKIISNCTWTGTTSTAWATATNWNAGAVPNGGVDVLILAGTPNAPVIGTAVATDRLTIQNGAVLTAGGSGTLTTGSLVNNGGFVVAPGGTYMGSYTNISGIGSFTLQQTITGQRGWRMLANPFATPTNIATVAATNGIAIGTTVPASGLTDSRVYSNATDGWLNVTGSIWAANTPYALFIRGLASEVTGSSYTAGPSTFTYSVSGVLNGASTTLTPDAANHFMVTGNPYVAPVTTAALTNGAGKPYYIYQVSQGANQTAQRTKAGGWIAQVSSSSTATIPVLGVIAYKPATTTAYNITTSNIKTNGTLQTGIFGDEAPVQYLELNIEQQGILQDKLFVRIGDSTNGLTKLVNDNTNLYTIDTAHHYWGIDARQQLKDSIAVGISATSGDYRFAVANHTLNNTIVYLKDNWLHTQTLLNAGVSYAFSITTDVASKGEQRFELLFVNNTPVVTVPPPAGSSAFTARLLQNLVALTGQVHVAITGSNHAMIRITDANGKTLAIQAAVNGINYVPLNNASKGMYFVQVSDGGASIVNKLVVE